MPYLTCLCRALLVQTRTFSTRRTRALSGTARKVGTSPLPAVVHGGGVHFFHAFTLVLSRPPLSFLIKLRQLLPVLMGLHG